MYVTNTKHNIFPLCSQSSYSQLLAATCLSKLVSRTSNPLPLEQRIDIREYISIFQADLCSQAPFESGVVGK